MDVAAALALNIDSSSVVKATKDLERFAAASDRAAASASRPISSTAKMAQDYARAADKATQFSGAGARAAAANDNMAAAATRMAGANDNAARSLAAVATAAQQADAHVQAFRTQAAAGGSAVQQSNAHVLAYRESLNKVGEGAKAAGTAIRFTAQEGLNATRQLADIGVTAAMGMSPFLIAVQQGPQLLDILQNKAAVTGQSLGAVFRAAAASAAAALAPFLPLIAAVGLLAAGIAALTAQANDDSGLKKYTTAMGYTKAEVEKLNAVTVTFGDTAKAVFQVGMDRIATALGISTEQMASRWGAFLDLLMRGTRATIAGIYAGFVTLSKFTSVQGVAETIIKGQGNPFSGVIEQAKDAYADAQGFMDDVVAQAQKNARTREDAMAKAFYDKPSTRKGPKTDADRFQDIVESAQNAIAAEKARAQAVGMAAEEASTLQKRQELLNAANSAGIKLTAGMRAEIDKLAASYGAAKVAADVEQAIDNTTSGIEKQRTAVQEQARLVGLYGDKLARVTRELDAQRQLREALPNGAVVVIPNLTSGLSDDIEANARAQRLADLRKASEDAAYAMDLERAGLGLTGAAALEYAYVTERLIAAKQKGIDLSPAEIAAIEAAGAAYGQQRYAIDQAAQGMADAREVTKGFASDAINGLRQTGDAFKSFADAATNALNRVIDKLLDKTLDGFLNGLFPSGPAKLQSASLATIASNPAIFAKGGAFGTAQRFAKGGAFTNSIVNTPTLFRFANGAALGEMGEAGPEAVMPLKRGPNGSLGVQMHGGGGRPSVRMGDVHNHISLAGALGPDSVALIAQQIAEQSEDKMRRGFQSMAMQWEADGAMV